MKKIILVAGLSVYGVVLAAPSKIPEITCGQTQYLDNKWLAVCNNGIDELDISGVGVCSDQQADNLFKNADKIIASDDDEDNINCWCRIVAPFKSQYIFHSTSLYANECNNWCAAFCARDIATKKAFRNALFSEIQ